MWNSHTLHRYTRRKEREKPVQCVEGDANLHGRQDPDECGHLWHWLAYVMAAETKCLVQETQSFS